MIVPTVVIFGLSNPDLKNLESDEIEILSTFETSKNLKEILIKDKPDVLITIGDNWKLFPEFNDTPFFIKRKWLHYKSLDDVKPYNIIHCFRAYIFGKHNDYPLITLFTTTYKSAHKIQRPYRSLMNQSYLDWEWIIMDDSDDDGETFRMLEELANTDYRIRLYRDSKHSGVIGKMKRDVAMMGYGDILVELDHDDDFLPHTLKLIKDAFASDPEIGMVYSDYSEIFEDGKNFNYPEHYAYGFGSYLKVLYNGRWINAAQSVPFNASTLRHIIGVPNHIRAWRASAYRELGGHNQNLHVADDYEIILRTFLKYKVCRIPKCLYIQYRNYGGNNFTFIRNKEIQKLVKHIWPYYKEDVLKRCDELGVYSIDTDSEKDWEKDPSPLSTKRGAELIYDPNCDRTSIILLADKHRKDLIRSIRSVMNQTYNNWSLYVIGADSPILEAVMEMPEFKRSNIFWWNMDGVRSEIKNKTIINYALKMIVTTDNITFIKSGTEWNQNHLETMIDEMDDLAFFIKQNRKDGTDDNIENVVLTRYILDKIGYYKNSDSEFINRLKSSINVIDVSSIDVPNDESSVETID